jgi:two-component system, chemotaxis family, chemotaxis protein CheY
MRLLIVDDSNIIRRSIQREIGDQNHEIRMAGDGIEALKVFEDFKPDIVTMDITMPNMDGLSCVEQILKRNAATRILVISALADKGTAVEAVKRGATGFLLKPFTSETLATEITELFVD